MLKLTAEITRAILFISCKTGGRSKSQMLAKKSIYPARNPSVE
jgi:hypothetical protein